MFPFVPIIIGGGVLAAGVTLVKRHRPATLLPRQYSSDANRLVQQLAPHSTLQASTATSLSAYGNQLKSELQKVTTTLSSRASKADEQYQRWVQLYIDPLLGKTRYDQIQLLHEGDLPPVGPEEQAANRRLALGVTALGTALLGNFFAPLTWVAAGLGLSAVWTIYYYAYLQWKAQPRVGVTHLLCIYLAFLWLGGYAAIGALGVLLLGIGLKVKAVAENQSRNNLVNLFQLQPRTVWVRSLTGDEVEIPFANLQVGDTLVLHAGQIAPVDGVIVAGNALLDQHMLTGEAQPAEKGVGESVLAATLLVAGQLDLRVEKTGAATTAGQLVEILNQTAQHNSALSLKAYERADQLAPLTLLASAVVLPLLGPASAVTLMGANFTTSTFMTSPLALLNFLNFAANRGILVKDGSVFDNLSRIDTIVFDKTGTLTLEQPTVSQLHVLAPWREDELLTLAAAAEIHQTHPIARAIRAAAAKRKLTLPTIDHAHYEVGYGIKVQLPQGIVRVGSDRFMALEGIALPASVQSLQTTCQATGHSLVMVALAEQLVGCLELQPTVRPEAKQIIAGLQQRGLALYIISGDQEAPTRKLAQDLGVTGYFANTLPEAKGALVEQLQQEGRQICFIGDGINDAIAMRKAQVSISLRGATTAATDTAQVILMEGNLNQLLHLFHLAEGFEHTLQQNFRFTAGVSVAAVAGVLLAGFTFAATEVLYTVALLGGLGITMKPLLEQQNKATLP